MNRVPDDPAVSLRLRLAGWLVPSLLAILLLSAVWSYNRAILAANHAYDRSLTTAIKGIAENIHATDGRISVDIPYSALDLVDEDVQERIFYAVLAADGTTLTGYDDLRLPTWIPAGKADLRMVDTRFRDHAVRLAVMNKRLYDPALSGGDTVTVLFAETTEARTQMALRLFFDSLRWQILLVVAAMVVLMFLLSSSLRPLLELSEAVRQRRPEDLTPVPVTDVPSEARPLIDAINAHIARLVHMLQARRRFLADAAHQIRTPLAVLGTQAEYGGRQDDPEEMRRTFQGMQGSIRSTRHLANQMLTLARAEQAEHLLQAREQVDFPDLVRDVAGDFALLAVQKEIDLAYESDGAGLMVAGNATMLRAAVTNLIDNALRYTPRGGHVTLEVRRREDDAVLAVCDDGPGIPPDEREKVFSRFYRVLGNRDSEGSGLGLCIVREIAQAHGGKVDLADGPGGLGLRVELCLPLSSDPLA